jgi:hypothetical protein
MIIQRRASTHRELTSDRHMLALGGEFNRPHAVAPSPSRTARVRCLATGEVLERAHVDCKEMIATGGYVAAD